MSYACHALELLVKLMSLIYVKLLYLIQFSVMQKLVGDLQIFLLVGSGLLTDFYCNYFIEQLPNVFFPIQELRDSCSLECCEIFGIRKGLVYFAFHSKTPRASSTKFILYSFTSYPFNTGWWYATRVLILNAATSFAN